MKTKLFKQKQTIFLMVFLAMMALLVTSCGGVATAMPAEVTVQDAYSFYKDGGYILDVRTPEEWVEGHIPGATLIPLEELPNRMDEVPDDIEVFIICRSGNRSAEARDLLLDNGFDLITSIDGGFNMWVTAKYPYDVGE